MMFEVGASRIKHRVITDKLTRIRIRTRDTTVITRDGAKRTQWARGYRVKRDRDVEGRDNDTDVTESRKRRS